MGEEFWHAFVTLRIGRAHSIGTTFKHKTAADADTAA